MHRERTFYDDRPDYSRPRLAVPESFRRRAAERLAFLYGDQGASAWMPELERILQVHHACKPPEMRAKELAYDPRRRFHQGHILLITYGDMVRGAGPTPLAVLRRFVERYARGAVNTIHLLPFFPYSSDRGFAVIDDRRVDERLGSWEDIRAAKQHYDLMFDAVLNHGSSRSELFQEFLNGNPQFKEFFIAFRSPDELTAEQRRKIFRPRTSDILTRFETIEGPRWVWTTFSPDQVDFNFRNPAVLLRIIESLLFYVRKGADLLRLDAVTYIWAEPGTESVHLPQTHEIVKLLRDVVDLAASGVALVTETNVPHAQNVAYFGNGRDEANLVYNFALPPLVLHAFFTGDSGALSRWATTMDPPSEETAFLNILDTHDGIGLQGVHGILSAGEIDFLVEQARRRGAQVSFKSTEEGGSEPYEINTTWWSALNPGREGEEIGLQIERYLASRALALVLRGVPGIYIHGALGTENDYRAAKASGVFRDLNRGIIEEAHVEEALRDQDSKLSRLFRGWRDLLLVRRRERAFHPRGAQRVLMLSPRVFALRRTTPEGDESVLTLTGVSAEETPLRIRLQEAGLEGGGFRDLLSGRIFSPVRGILLLRLPPYGRLWLKAEEKSKTPAISSQVVI